MQLAPLLNGISDLLQTALASPVSLGPPGAGATGIFVWPWKLAVNPQSRKIPPNVVTSRPTAPAMDVHFIVLVTPAFTPEGLLCLEQAHQALFDRPVLRVGEATSEIAWEELDNETLSRLLMSASMPTIIVLSYVARM
jgi:hypothetical protein